VRPKEILLACFVLHFGLLITISVRDTLSLVAHKLTVLPASFSGAARNLESLVSTIAGQKPASSDLIRRGLLTYLHCAGIDRSYGYFAPNIPPSYKLVFELHYRDGRVEDELPRVNSAAAGLRVSGLLDEIGRTRHDGLREYLIKALARSVWHDHPDVMAMRAIFGVRNVRTADEFARGAPESYRFLYAYDFIRQNHADESTSR
jgi:hypothetical protein